jgi:hypothetical protein
MVIKLAEQNLFLKDYNGVTFYPCRFIIPPWNMTTTNLKDVLLGVPDGWVCFGAMLAIREDMLPASWYTSPSAPPSTGLVEVCAYRYLTTTKTLTLSRLDGGSFTVGDHQSILFDRGYGIAFGAVV